MPTQDSGSYPLPPNFKKTEHETNEELPTGFNFYTHKNDGGAGKRMAETLLNTNCIMLWILLPFIGGVAEKAQQIYAVLLNLLFKTPLFVYHAKRGAADTGFNMHRVPRILEGVDFFA